MGCNGNCSSCSESCSSKEKKDLKLAAMMFKEMSDMGNIQATKNLAMCYLDGFGVKKNINTAYDLAMKVRSTTHDGTDGDIYYIEAKYYDSISDTPSGKVGDSFERAIRYGCSRAVKDYARYKSKYGLRWK